MSRSDLSHSELRALTADDFARIRHLRATDHGAVARAYAGRVRRTLSAGDGRLFIVAADHPARGALGVGNNPRAMENRHLLLDRLAIALANPRVDGVLGTPDILDDLALLGLLDDRIAVGSMNRGGLKGAAFELDDRFTAYDVPSMSRAGIDFAKLLVRISLTDPGTLNTLEAVARVVSEAAAAELPIMLEPFMCKRSNGHVINDLSPEAVIASIAIASGLGNSSALSWLKLPVVDEMERVLTATTLPTLLLGGDTSHDTDATYASWEKALCLPGVNGLVVGRSMLYPADGDVATAIDIASGLVHSARA
jgi:DhnA family fructose-bisphosphate aldolase class Ia